MEIFANILGFIAGAILLVALQFKKRVFVVFGIVLANLVWAVSFFILGIYSGAIFILLLSIQGTLSYLVTNHTKNETIPYWLMGIYYLVIITLIVVFYIVKLFVGPIDIIPAVCAVLTTTVLLLKNSTLIRVFQGLIVSALWTTYAIILLVYGNIVSNGLILISGVIAVIRLDILPRVKKKTVIK